MRDFEMDLTVIDIRCWDLVSDWAAWTGVYREADRLQAVPRASSDGQGSALSHLLQHGIAGLASLALLGSPALAPPASQATTFLTSDETSTVNLFQASKPGVVRDTFTLNMLEVPQGAGSGMVWDAQGHIVTNYHVIRGASEVLVTMTGGEDYPATVVGVDQDRDVAVLQLQGLPAEKSVTPLKIGSSANLKVGQRVFAIGNPFGLDHTLTTGVISGTGREIPGATGRPIQDVIQTDAAINPGNSGGPLLDSGGELIGVNTAIYSPSGANSGVGFAIPVDIVRSSVDQIVRFGRVTRPMLGIAFAPEQSAEQLGVRGVLVLDARKGSPADEAGIKGTSRDEYGRLVLGDIIISIDGARVKTGSDLFRALDKRSVGDALDVEVLRGNDRSHVAITLAASNT
ncbi:Protease Do-like 1, chloroplastic [Auxenochlorella protothecoides]|uniref:Protease Do-like 1, chloroplastic n=1 Tax=Auxenochlorella protothecoides TaxID=3075 RepID=A0A087SLX8_AUXPR|nr:Protease Do-like 1, chloroplastic [Auxenochlorella protothecoides]KFM26732.1 Protease Do-like 1, chloroplastic [Auxenochlorella protothecoides]